MVMPCIRHLCLGFLGLGSFLLMLEQVEDVEVHGCAAVDPHMVLVDA